MGSVREREESLKEKGYFNNLILRKRERKNSKT